MMRALFLFAFLAFATLSAPTVEARSLRFGEDHRVSRIMDIDLEGPEGEDLYLGHLIKTQFFLLGVYVEDSGYAFGIVGENEGYYPFPDEKLIKKLQVEGALPDPLPAYKLELLDYLFGYSLWLLLLGVGIWFGVKSMFSRKTA
jgi:hypothetical protein